MTLFPLVIESFASLMNSIFRFFAIKYKANTGIVRSSQPIRDRVEKPPASTIEAPLDKFNWHLELSCRLTSVCPSHLNAPAGPAASIPFVDYFVATSVDENKFCRFENVFLSTGL